MKLICIEFLAGKWLQNNIKELQSVFDGIRHQSADGSEYWNSRELSDALGYSGYWKFRTVIDKAIAVANDKGMRIDDHFNQSVDMVRLGSGSFRKVDVFHLSRLACLIIAENADGKKPMVLQARQFLTMNDYKATESAETISQEEAREKAYGEYDKFKVIQDRTFVSDFDKFNGESVSGSDTPLLPFDINPKDD